jgi:hypothetical protein
MSEEHVLGLENVCGTWKLLAEGVDSSKRLSQIIKRVSVSLKRPKIAKMGDFG